MVSLHICRFMVGTEEGCILSCNRAKGQEDRTSAIFDGDDHPIPLVCQSLQGCSVEDSAGR